MKKASYERLAQEFIDLWQKQIAALASDKAFIHVMLEMIQSMQSHGAHSTHSAFNASDAVDAEHGGLSGLALRLEACERRIAALETRGPRKSHRKASKKPRR